MKAIKAAALSAPLLLALAAAAADHPGHAAPTAHSHAEVILAAVVALLAIGLAVKARRVRQRRRGE